MGIVFFRSQTPDESRLAISRSIRYNFEAQPIVILDENMIASGHDL
jgi:hypothetical protein